MTTLERVLTFDFRQALESNRLKGIWRMMADYRVPYIIATVALAFSALAKTLTFLLLRFYADQVLADGQYLGGESHQHAGLDRRGIHRPGGVRGHVLVPVRPAGGLYCRGHHPAPARLPVRPHPAAEPVVPLGNTPPAI